MISFELTGILSNLWYLKEKALFCVSSLMVLPKNTFSWNIKFPCWKYLLFWIWTFTLCSQSAFSQTYSPILENLNTLSSRNQHDLIYIQLSKGIYETGEDLWFKTYVLDNQHFMPSAKSKVLHVKVINEDSLKTVWEEKYEIVRGFADGHIYLGDTLSEGNYRLIAYTENSGYKGHKEYRGSRKLKIVGSIANKLNVKKEYVKKFDTLLLCPEGGDLIAHLNNRVAFKAMDSVAYPVNVSGTLFMDGVPQVRFTSEHDGMGSFDFIPIPGRHYMVKIDQDNENRSFPMALALSTGAVLKSIKSLNNQP